MARRRVRIAAGFGQGGRAALIGSLLPSAQDQAEAKRVQRIKDNEKITAFNNDQITFAELEAYFMDRQSKAIDETDRAEVSSMLTAAKAANESKETNSALNAVKLALTNLQNGDALYEDVTAIIEANRGKVKKPEAVAQLDSMAKTARTIKVARDVTKTVDDYNAGGGYTEASKKLRDILNSETNESLKGQIGTALTTMRTAENNRYLKSATDEFNLTGDINRYADALGGLIEQPDQTSPDEVSRIQAALETGLVVAQQMVDSKNYYAWQTHQIDDAKALAYFQGRLATAKNPKELDYLGKYAANVQQAMDNAEKQAQSRAASVGRNASSAANAAVSRQDSLNKYQWDYFEDTTFKKMLKDAGEDPLKISRAYDIRKAILTGPDGQGGLAAQGGYYASQYALMAKLNEEEKKDTISTVLWDSYEAAQAKTLKKVEDMEDKLSLKKFSEHSLDIATRALDVLGGPNTNYFSDSQKKTAMAQRNDALQAVSDRLDMEKVRGQKGRTEFEVRVADLYGGLGVSKDAIAREVSKDLGREINSQQLTPEVFSTWMLQDPKSRVVTVYNASLSQKQREGQKPGEAREFVSEFLEAYDATQLGHIIGGDPEFKRAYMEFLRVAHPVTWGKFTANEMLAGAGGDDEETVDSMRRDQMLDRLSSQPFMGSELPSGPDNPDPGTTRVFDLNGEPARPTWQPVDVSEIPMTDKDGKPLTSAERTYIAYRMSIGDDLTNAIEIARLNADWYDEASARRALGVANQRTPEGMDPSTPGYGDALGRLWSDISEEAASRWDIAGKTYGGIWQSLAGQAQEPTPEDMGQELKNDWMNLNAFQSEKWQEGGTNFWEGVEANIVNTWNDTVALFNGVSAVEPTGNEPTWGGWDSLTTDAQASIQTLIDNANQTGFAFNEPGGAVGPEPVVPLANIDTQGDQWWNEPPAESWLDQYDWESMMGGGSGGGESTSGPSFTQ